MKNVALGILTAAALAALSATAPERAEAQTLQLRAGADVRPLLYYNSDIDEGGTLADFGYLGLTVAPGLRIARVFAIEVALTPMIPIIGDFPYDPDFFMQVTPGVIVDLQLAYARAGVPIQIHGDDSSVGLELAAGLSFLGAGYIGAVADFDTNSTFWLGAEIGIKLGL